MELYGDSGFDFGTFSSQNNQFKFIPTSMLIYNNEYERYTGADYEDMVASIKKNGILQPLIVRANGNGTFTILAGNNRRYCGEAAGLTSFPCVVKENLSDEEAQAYIDETNVFQRGFDKLKISKQAEVIARRHESMFDPEKLKAIQEEIMNYTGNTASGGSKLAQVGRAFNLSQASVARLVRVNSLIKNVEGFKDPIDNGKIKIRTAIALSYLKKSEQERVLELFNAGKKLDMKKAEMLKNYSQNDSLPDYKITEIMEGKYTAQNKADITPKKGAIQLPNRILKKYFADVETNEEITKIIESALKSYYGSKR